MLGRKEGIGRELCPNANVDVSVRDGGMDDK
jgi:hypothetical protein